MPVVKGQKSDSEKFAGAQETYSIEALTGLDRARRSLREQVPASTAPRTEGDWTAAADVGILFASATSMPPMRCIVRGCLIFTTADVRSLL